jgi:hypothetical protein
MSRWFRFYAEVAHDPKVQLLEPELFKAWVTILCLACERGGPLPGMREIAFTLRVTEMQADSILQALRVTGLIDDNGEHMVPHNWHKRQYVDRTNAERQKKYRQKQALAKSVTSQDRNALRERYEPLRNAHTDTDTDTDTDNKKLKTKARPKPRVSDDDFDAFYWAYPKHVEKGQARKAYEKAVRAGASPEAILAGARRYAAATGNREKKYVKNPASWLNACGWEDDAPRYANVVPLGTATVRAWTEEELEAEAREMGAY